MVTILIPCYNEQESLKLLYEEIVRHIPSPYEILFIDDGSTDGSFDVIKELTAIDKNVHVLSFRRNFGKAAALQAGFHNAKGDIIITMDADLQDDPAEIPKFIEKIDEGYDLVSGWKFVRNDPLEKRLPSKLFNKVISGFSKVKLHDFNCGYKAYRKEVVQSIDLYGELHRYIPVLAARKGFRIGEIVVNHNERKFGKSKYGMERYLRGLFDCFTVVFLNKYYDRPMHFFGKLGLLSMTIGMIMCIYLTVIWLLGQPIGNRPLLQLGVLAILVGVQLFSIGLVGDMLVARTARSRYDESHIKERI